MSQDSPQCEGSRPCSSGSFPQAPASPSPSPYALSNLLRQVESFKALAMEPGPANELLSPLVTDLFQLLARTEPTIADVLARFGWMGPQHGFIRTLDLPGFTAALKKLRWTKVDVLGCGSFGVVHRARNRETNEYVAIKKLWQPSTEDGFAPSTIREVSALRELRHENIIRYVALLRCCVAA